MTLTVEEPRAGFARRAEGLHENGDSEGALRLLTQGTRRFPGDVTALVVLARICRETGREAAAREWIRAALRLDPGCPAARAADAEAGRTAAPGPASASAPATITTTAPVREIVDVHTPAAPADVVDDMIASLQPEARIVPRDRPTTVAPSPFVFPDHVEEDDDEVVEFDGNSAPHIATVTLAEIYLQQGLKEQAAQIYRQLLEQQPDDESVRERLQAILRRMEEP